MTQLFLEIFERFVKDVSTQTAEPSSEQQEPQQR
jgi:hypothetical protein